MKLKPGDTFTGSSGLKARVTAITDDSVEFEVERRWKQTIEKRTRQVSVTNLDLFLKGYHVAK